MIFLFNCWLLDSTRKYKVKLVAFLSYTPDALAMFTLRV
jgi:hypothetical protein